MIREFSSVALVALLVGCTCSQVEEPPSTGSNLIPTHPSATSEANLGPEPSIDLESLPVEEDYEADAERDITPNTLVDKVNELDEEISKK